MSLCKTTAPPPVAINGLTFIRNHWCGRKGEGQRYSCLNPVLGVYADTKLIGVVTYQKPKAAKEAVVSIEMPP